MLNDERNAYAVSDYEYAAQRPWQAWVVAGFVLIVFAALSLSVPQMMHGCDSFGCLAVYFLILPIIVPLLYILAYVAWGVLYGKRRVIGFMILIMGILSIFTFVVVFAGVQDYIYGHRYRSFVLPFLALPGFFGDTFYGNFLPDAILLAVCVAILMLSIDLYRHPFYRISSSRSTSPPYSLREMLIIMLSKDRSLRDIRTLTRSDWVLLGLLSVPSVVGMIGSLIGSVDATMFLTVTISIILEVSVLALFFIGGQKVIKRGIIIFTILVVVGTIYLWLNP